MERRHAGHSIARSRDRACRRRPGRQPGRKGAQRMAAPAGMSSAGQSDLPRELPWRVRKGWRERLKARVRGLQSREQLEAGGLRVGLNVLIAGHVTIDPGFMWLIEIGDDATIAPGVHIIAHDAA